MHNAHDTARDSILQPDGELHEVVSTGDGLLLLLLLVAAPAGGPAALLAAGLALVSGVEKKLIIASSVLEVETKVIFCQPSIPALIFNGHLELFRLTLPHPSSSGPRVSRCHLPSATGAVGTTGRTAGPSGAPLARGQHIGQPGPTSGL